MAVKVLKNEFQRLKRTELFYLKVKLFEIESLSCTMVRLYIEMVGMAMEGNGKLSFHFSSQEVQTIRLPITNLAIKLLNHEFQRQLRIKLYQLKVKLFK